MCAAPDGMLRDFSVPSTPETGSDAMSSLIHWLFQASTSTLARLPAEMRSPRESPQPFSSFKGFAVTFRQMFKKPITQQYPDYKRPVYPRFRGRHRLWKHANGLEKCVGCSLCAAACPASYSAWKGL